MPKRVFLVLIFLASITAFIGLNWGLLQAAPAPAAQPILRADEDGGMGETAVLPADPTFIPPALFTSRHADGRITTQNLGVFGPASCTPFGDPYSPDASPWVPGLYTYQFEIHVPAGYPHDIVRVELFDPDSINQPGNTFTITRSQLAQSLGLPPTTNLTCSSSQVNPCVLDTGERSLPGVTLDEINPLWLVRLDENRTGTLGSNSGCGAPATYTPSFNTQTVYELVYYAQNPDGTTERVLLATYTGQVGDGVRDNGNHLTDMQWVSPGAPLGMGQPVPVPTNCGSANGGDYDPVTCPGGSPISPGRGFEVNLTQFPNLPTDPLTGARLLQVEVTTITGASENGFDIWAGPPVYVNDVPGDVNLRNLHIADNSGGHDPQGVSVRAIGTLLVNSNISFRVNIPILEIGAEFAGQTIFVTLFDSDAGSQPPLHFFFDTIAFDDWHVTYSNNDPLGRCTIGSCNNQWVTPAYTITVPGDLANCDYANPSAACIPFYGGRLMASYQSGNHDTYAWQAQSLQAPPWDPTQSCAAMPTAVSLFSYSVISSTYPAANQFTYPLNPPAYSDFPNHRPDIPLPDAQEGDVYLFPQGFGAGNFGWLAWNTGIAVSAATLANSLTWPGDTLDYTNHGDGGIPATPFYPWVVRGYVNPMDTSDVVLQMGDWVAANTGSVNSNAVRAALNGHIDLGRQLRLLVWDESANGANGRFRTHSFAIFNIVGYRMGAPDDWLLLEFMQWDDSCGQMAPPTELTLAGPELGFTGQSYTFTAVVSPPSTTLPITYTWQADEQDPVTHTGGLSDAVTWAWPVPGPKTITVTAENSLGQVTATHAITIFPSDLTLTTAVVGDGSLQVEPDLPLYLHGTVVTLTAVADPGWLFAGWSGDLGGSANPATLLMDDHKSITATFQIDPASLLTAVLLDGPPVGMLGETIPFTATAQPATAFTPITYTWQADGQEPIIHTGGLTDTVSFVWPEAWMVTVTVTAANAFNAVTATHLIAIFSDSLMLETAVVGSGSVQVEPDLPLYLHGTVVTVTAVADPGWLFAGWSGDLDGSANPATLLMDDHKSITATFQVDPASLLTGLVLVSPAMGMPGETLAFSARVLPETALSPITYTWQTNGQEPIIHTGGLTDTISFAWPAPGLYTVAVTAENGVSTVTATTVVNILPWRVYLPVVRSP